MRMGKGGLERGEYGVGCGFCLEGCCSGGLVLWWCDVVILWWCSDAESQNGFEVASERNRGREAGTRFLPLNLAIGRRTPLVASQEASFGRQIVAVVGRC